jgi:hypothetical protein
MSVLPLVRTGASALQATIDAVERFGADADTLAVRLGVAQLLRFQAKDATASVDDQPLLDAYRDWLTVAEEYYRPDTTATDRQYARASAILIAEVTLAEDRGDTRSTPADAAAATAASPA